MRRHLGRAALVSALVVGALVVLRVLLLVLPGGDSGSATEEPALSPSSSEVWVGAGSVLLLFVVLTLVIAFLRAWRERRTSGVGRS